MSNQIKELVDGLNDVSNADYHADRKYLSSSVLKIIYKSLEHYKSKYLDGTPDPAPSNSAALEDGSLTHAILLDPATLHTEFAFYPGLRKQGDEFEKFKAAAGTGKIIISKPQKLRVDSFVKAAQRRPEAMELLKGGFPEQTICGTLDGVPIKVRFDYINVDKGYISDVKTTAYPADPETFKSTLNKLSYQLSAALYCAMAEQFYGKKFEFYFIVISKQDPQDCQVYKTSEATMAEGRAMVQRALEKYKLAKSKNIWDDETLGFVDPEPVDKLEERYEILEV